MVRVTRAHAIEVQACSCVWGIPKWREARGKAACSSAPCQLRKQARVAEPRHRHACRLGSMRYTWPSGRPGSAQPGHGPGTARRMSGRHGTPCLPCRAATGLVPCHQPKHGHVGLNPCRAGLLGTTKSPGRASPRPVGFKTHQKIHLNKKYSNLKYFFPRRALNQNHTHREQEEIKRITELCAMLPH